MISDPRGGRAGGMEGRSGGARTNTVRAQIALRERILSGALRPGERIFEVPVAETLEMSRTPVREAMSRLAEEGLLERAPSGGFLVRAFSLDEVRDAIELRGLMEGFAVRLAAERGADPEALAEMAQIVAALDAAFAEGSDALDLSRYSELNAAFHARLPDLPGSAMVRAEVERVTSLPFASPTAFLQGRTRSRAFRLSLLVAQDQHRRLIEAVSNREGGRAEHIAREHARLARHNLDTSLKEDPSLLDSVPGMSLIVE